MTNTEPIPCFRFDRKNIAAVCSSMSLFMSAKVPNLELFPRLDELESVHRFSDSLITKVVATTHVYNYRV